MKRNKIVSILEYSARNKMLVGILAVSLIGAGGVFLSSNATISNNTMGINKIVLAGTLNNDGNKACVINGNDSLVLYTSASNSNIQSYISVGEMLTINSYSNGYYNVTVQETGATGYIASSNMQKIVSGVGYDLTSLSGTGYVTNVSTVVNLRENATMNSETLAKLKNNTSVTLLGKQGDWYKISDNGTTGYIYGEYIAIANSNTTSSSSSNSSTVTSSNTSKTTGTTKSNSSNSSTKATSSKSSTSNISGTPSNSGSSSNQTSRIAYVYQPTGNGEAGVYHYVPYTIQTESSAFETALESGTKITVLGEFGDNYNIEFYKIEFGDNEIGYIPTKYVSFNKPENSSTSSSSTTGTTTKSTSGTTSNTESSSSSNSATLSQLKQEYMNQLNSIESKIMKLPKAETDVQQMYSYSTQLGYWNTEMNNILNKLQQVLPKSEVAQLQTGQQEWVYNNNAAVNKIRNLGGSMSGVNAIQADAGFTASRCYELIVTYM